MSQKPLTKLTKVAILLVQAREEAKRINTKKQIGGDMKKALYAIIAIVLITSFIVDYKHTHDHIEPEEVVVTAVAGA